MMTMMNNYYGMLEVPVGYRFVPSDDKLIGFLLRRAMGRLPTVQSPINPILERDLYGENASPWDVFADVSDAQWITCPTGDDAGAAVKEIKNVKKTIYAYTKLSKVSAGKTRVARTAGCGTWHGETGATKIYDVSTGQLIGARKMFTFRANKGKANNGDDHWIMHEFSLAGACLDRELMYPDLVICKITRSSKVKKGNYGTTDQGCPMMMSTSLCAEEKDGQPPPIPRITSSSPDADQGHDLGFKEPQTEEERASSSSKKRSGHDELTQIQEHDATLMPCLKKHKAEESNHSDKVFQQLFIQQDDASISCNDKATISDDQQLLAANFDPSSGTGSWDSTFEDLDDIVDLSFLGF